MSGRVYLASASPRRRELLKMIVPDFEILSGIDVDETFPDDMPAHEVPVFLSQIKASAYLSRLADGDILITADTVVIIDGKILGKPIGREDAVEMLTSLENHTHTVVTGVTITTTTSQKSWGTSTQVHFDKLSREDIEYYVDRYKPYDKAGAYGIQEWIGAAGIKGIEGSFYNVMGLPVHSLYKELSRHLSRDGKPL